MIQMLKDDESQEVEVNPVTLRLFQNAKSKQSKQHQIHVIVGVLAASDQAELRNTVYTATDPFSSIFNLCTYLMLRRICFEVAEKCLSFFFKKKTGSTTDA